MHFLILMNRPIFLPHLFGNVKLASQESPDNRVLRVNITGKVIK